MEDLERLVAGRLRALDEASPSPEAAARVLGTVRVQVTKRRRRRRALQSVAGASMVAVAVVAAPALLDGGTGAERTVEPAPLAVTGHREPTPEATEKILGGSVAPSAPTKTEEPDRPHGPAAGGTLPGGSMLSAFGVASDGAVLGEGLSGSASDGTLWRADLTDLLAAPVPVAKTSDLTMASGGDGITVWPEDRGTGHEQELMCQDGSGQTFQLGDGGVTSAAFHADGEYAVWTDEGATVWSAKGCSDTPRKLSAGLAAGFAYPYAYVLATEAGRPTGELQRLQVETGDTESHTLPAGLLEGGDRLYAAGKDTFAVAHGTALTVFDTTTWKPRTLGKKLPASPGRKTFLTAGDDLVVYSSRSAAPRSLIYDVSAAKAKTAREEAFTKGPWLLTRASLADDYTLKPTS